MRFVDDDAATCARERDRRSQTRRPGAGHMNRVLRQMEMRHSEAAAFRVRARRVPPQGPTGRVPRSLRMRSSRDAATGSIPTGVSSGAGSGPSPTGI
ncbi:MAG: hypothetical protein AMXMBFR72_27470 [Betaproteobacteria bacterium]